MKARMGELCQAAAEFTESIPAMSATNPMVTLKPGKTNCRPNTLAKRIAHLLGGKTKEWETALRVVSTDAAVQSEAAYTLLYVCWWINEHGDTPPAFPSGLIGREGEEEEQVTGQAPVPARGTTAAGRRASTTGAGPTALMTQGASAGMAGVFTKNTGGSGRLAAVVEIELKAAVEAKDWGAVAMLSKELQEAKVAEMAAARAGEGDLANLIAAATKDGDWELVASLATRARAATKRSAPGGDEGETVKRLRAELDQAQEQARRADSRIAALERQGHSGGAGVAAGSGVVTSGPVRSTGRVISCDETFQAGQLPTKQHELALAGKFVSFPDVARELSLGPLADEAAEVLPVQTTTTAGVTTLSVPVQKKAATIELTHLLWETVVVLWLESMFVGWPGYTAALKEYVRYVRSLATMFLAANPTGFMRYDADFRARAAVAMTRGDEFAWTTPSTMIYQKYFTGCRPGACANCGSHVHETHACKMSSLTKRPKATATTSAAGITGRSLVQGACFSWNVGNKCDATKCRFNHVCRSCGADHKWDDKACPMRANYELHMSKNQGRAGK